jgi:HK97 family phage prohead protease
MTSAALLEPSIGWSAMGESSDRWIIKEAIGDDLYVAGYASVDMVDKQGDRIPPEALKKAFGRFMKNAAFRNVQLAHSGIQVGEVVDSFSDSQGRVWKSEVDNHGLFVVCRIRSDIQKAREVQKQVRDGELRAFSIGGQALFRVSKHTPEHGSHREITDLELHEITLCKKGINPEARYTILKMDDDGVGKMTENEALVEIRNSLSGILKAIDKNEEKSEEKSEEKEDVKEETTEKSEDSSGAVAYIDTLEKFAHEQGVNLDAVREHYGLAKAYLQEGKGGYSHRGQGDEIGSGEDASEPSYPSLSAPGGNKYVIKQPGVSNMAYNGPKGNQNVIKSGNEITPAGLERGYRAYAGLRDEEALKSLVKQEWEGRYDTETIRALEVQKANDYGGQITTLKAEIENLRTEATEIQKSATAVPMSDIRIPTHEEFAAMGNDLDAWRATEDLARRALRGE